MVLLRRRDWAGGAGPVVEVPRMDVPRPPVVAPAVEVDAGAAVVVVVVEGCEVVVVAAADAGLSGTLKKLPSGALEEASGTVDETGVCAPEVPRVAVPRLKTLALGTADDVVVGWLNKLLIAGALVDEGCDNVPLKSDFVFSAVVVAACMVDGVAEGNWKVLDLSEVADDVGG